MTAAKEGGVQLSHLTLATTKILTDASDVEVARGGDGMGQRREDTVMSFTLQLHLLAIVLLCIYLLSIHIVLKVSPVLETELS